MGYKSPGKLLTASVVWPGAWPGPIGIKPAESILARRRPAERLPYN